MIKKKIRSMDINNGHLRACTPAPNRSIVSPGWFPGAVLVLSLLFSAPSPANVLDISPAQLPEFLSTNKDVVVQFTSPDNRCGYCTASAKQSFDVVSEHVGMGVKFIRVQWSPWFVFPKEVLSLGINRVPAQGVFKDGKGRYLITGAIKNPKRLIVALTKFYSSPSAVQKGGNAITAPAGRTRTSTVIAIPAGRAQAGTVIAVPAGSTQTRTISLAWPGRPTGIPPVSVRHGPVGVTATATLPRKGALPIRIACPSTLAPGLYPLALRVGSGVHATAVTLRLAVDALYIGTGLQNGGIHPGVVVESPQGHPLTRASQALSAQFIVPHEPYGMAYDPARQALYTVTNSGHVIVTTTLGQPLSVPFPIPTMSTVAPTFIAWMGQGRLVFSGSDTAVFSDNGSPETLPGDGDNTSFAWRGTVNGMSADPATGEIFMGNDEAAFGAPMDRVHVFNAAGTQTAVWPAARSVQNVIFNPWNRLVYVLTGHSYQGHNDPRFAAFHSDGTPASLSASFPGLFGVNYSPTYPMVAANPANGHLYMLTEHRIFVYGPEGGLIRSMSAPAGAHSIAFVPQTLTLPTHRAMSARASATGNPAPIATPQPVPAQAAPGCPPGYRCVPNGAATPPSTTATPNAPSVTGTIDHASNTIGNVDNLANNVSNLLNAFQ